MGAKPSPSPGPRQGVPGHRTVPAAQPDDAVALLKELARRATTVEHNLGLAVGEVATLGTLMNQTQIAKNSNQLDAPGQPPSLDFEREGKLRVEPRRLGAHEQLLGVDAEPPQPFVDRLQVVPGD